MSTRAQLKSFQQILRELGPRQREVVIALERHPEGMSAWELSSELKRFVHAVRPRITELKQLGVIRQVGERYEHWTERLEAKWALVKFDDQGQLEMAI